MSVTIVKHRQSTVGLLYRVSVIYTAVKPQSMSRESMDFKEIADENWDASQLVLHKCVCVYYGISEWDIITGRQ